MFALTIGIIVAVTPLALGLTPLQTFYPPDLNDPEYIADAAIGTYGGVYQAPTSSENTSAPYGTYNYCTMPHPRVEEYTLPEAISNGSVKGSLIYLEYMQRHQRRTPYNILPGGEVSHLKLTFVVLNPGATRAPPVGISAYAAHRTNLTIAIISYPISMPPLKRAQDPYQSTP